MQTIKKLIHNTVEKLVKADIELNEAQIETGLLVEHIFGFSKISFILNPSLEVPGEELEQFNSLVQKRVEQKIPVQYLINKAFFMGEDFYVDKNVLIPRPETEMLVEKIVELAGDNSRIIDIGTGSGCIAVMLAKKLSTRHPEQSEESPLPKDDAYMRGDPSVAALPQDDVLQITASDVSQKALEVAKRNAEKLGANVRFIHSDIFENIDEKFDVIVSNPPYIPAKERESLQIEVSRHEPALALFADDEEGVGFYKKLAEQAAEHLNPGGFLAVEIGISQANTVQKIFEQNGFKNIEIIKDFANIERVVIIKK